MESGIGSSRWRVFTRQLWGSWRGRGCFFCGHRIVPGLGEVEHRISPSLRPELAWAPWWKGEEFLVPVHGGGKRRCPEPSCDLDCNAIAGSNAAPRDALGRSAAWSPEFLARKQEERRTYRGREGRGSVAKRAARNRGLMPGSWAVTDPRMNRPRPEPFTPAAPRVPHTDAGRAWLRGV